MAQGQSGVPDSVRDSETLHHILFENTAQGVVYQDCEGKLITANPAAQRILGLALDQLRGKSPIDPRFHVIQSDGQPVHVDEMPTLVALLTSQAQRSTLLKVFNPREGAYR